MTPSKGLFTHGLLDKGTALIRFHQTISQTNGMIIYPPNGEGVWKIVFAVPMRIPPNMKIRFEDEALTVEELSKSVAVVRFCVKDRNGDTIKEARRIMEIVASAEL